MTRCPIAAWLGLTATVAGVVLLAPAAADAAGRRSQLGVKVEVVERCSATASGGRARLRDCPSSATVRTLALPAAAGSADAALTREIAASGEVRYLTVIY